MFVFGDISHYHTERQYYQHYTNCKGNVAFMDYYKVEKSVPVKKICRRLIYLTDQLILCSFLSDNILRKSLFTVNFKIILRVLLSENFY